MFSGLCCRMCSAVCIVGCVQWFVVQDMFRDLCCRMCSAVYVVGCVQWFVL